MTGRLLAGVALTFLFAELDILVPSTCLVWGSCDPILGMWWDAKNMWRGVPDIDIVACIVSILIIAVKVFLIALIMYFIIAIAELILTGHR